MQQRNIVFVDMQQFVLRPVHMTQIPRVFSTIAHIKRAVLGFGALMFEKKLEIGSIEKLLILRDETVEWQMQVMEI